MTMTDDVQGIEAAHASRLYRRLLALYPRSFRDQYGEQMVQVFEELAVSTHRAGARRGDLWARVLRDLIPSASRERGAVLLGPSGRGPLAFVLLAGLVALWVTGRQLVILLPFLLLIALPTAGVVLLRRAWLVRRTTGANPLRQAALAGAGLLAPAAVFLVAVGTDRGWYIVMTIILSLVCGSVVAAVWAVSNLAAGGAEAGGRPNRRRRAVLVLVSGVLIVGGIAAAGYNSYRNSQPPAGDHSVANASADSRALWEAAWAGDVNGTERLVTACADPFVQFSGHGQVDRRARSVADWRAGGWGNTDPVPEAERPPFRRVVTLLQNAEDTWSARCGSS